jgi:hypothetical protein
VWQNGHYTRLVIISEGTYRAGTAFTCGTHTTGRRMMMTIRSLFSLAVLACVGFLSLVLVDHLWSRYSQETEASGLVSGYERSSPAGSPDNPGADLGSAAASGARGSAVAGEAFSE